MKVERHDDPDACACGGESGEATRIGSEWSGWLDRVAHPDSPAGGGGPGHFSTIPLRLDESDLPSPWRPGPLAAVPLQGKPVPAPINPPPVASAEALGVCKHIQDATHDVHIEAEILADGGKPPTTGAETRFSAAKGFSSPQAKTAGNKVVSFTSKLVWKGTITIQTAYASASKPADPSCYGRGTTAEDVKAGNITLGFHESCHRADYKSYVTNHELPDPPTFSVGMTIDEYKRAHAGFAAALDTYFLEMERASVRNTDEVGHSLSTRKATKKCFKHAVP